MCMSRILYIYIILYIYMNDYTWKEGRKEGKEEESGLEGERRKERAEGKGIA